MAGCTFNLFKCRSQVLSSLFFRRRQGPPWPGLPGHEGLHRRQRICQGGPEGVHVLLQPLRDLLGRNLCLTFSLSKVYTGIELLHTCTMQSLDSFEGDGHGDTSEQNLSLLSLVREVYGEISPSHFRAQKSHPLLLLFPSPSRWDAPKIFFLPFPGKTEAEMH